MNAKNGAYAPTGSACLEKGKLHSTTGANNPAIQHRDILP